MDESADSAEDYVGGMAGTGKFKVIKALINFFEKREQSFIFLIMAHWCRLQHLSLDQHITLFFGN